MNIKSYPDLFSLGRNRSEIFDIVIKRDYNSEDQILINKGRYIPIYANRWNQLDKKAFDSLQQDNIKMSKSNVVPYRRRMGLFDGIDGFRKNIEIWKELGKLEGNLVLAINGPKVPITDIDGLYIIARSILGETYRGYLLNVPKDIMSSIKQKRQLSFL